MSARAHPRLVGAFVVLGIGLVLLAVLLLGSGTLFTQRERFAAFFPGSVQGLKAGAPVTFRGIPIGEVAEVKGVFTGRAAEIQVEVVLEIWRDRIQESARGQAIDRFSAAQLARYFIDRGIKAQMLSQSLLTGQKLIELDFHPDEPGRLAGIESRYPELPTVPSPLERLGAQLGSSVEDVLAKVAEFPIDDVRAVVKDMQRTLAAAADLMESGRLQRAADGVTRTASALQGSLKQMNTTVEEVGTTARDARAELQTTAARAREVLDRAERSLQAVERGADGAARLTPDLARTLEELSDAAASLRVLVDYLQQHPEDLVSGKPATESRR